MALECTAADGAAVDWQEEADALAERVAAGDEQAYAQFVERFMPAVYGFLCRLLNSSEDAEDLTQDTFFEVYSRRQQIDAKKNLKAYLFTIARRKAISHYRWRNVRRVLSPLTEVTENQAKDEGESPRDWADANREQDLLRKAMEGLSTDKRTVLILRFMEELDYESIAAVMKKPLGTVKSLAFRAEQELRERMQRRMGQAEVTP